MQTRHSISGFSELKELLIRTYRIEKARDLIKIYFSESNNELRMHDYDDHKKFIVLSKNIRLFDIRNGLSNRCKDLIVESLMTTSPAIHLNEQFKLHGFFRL